MTHPRARMIDGKAQDMHKESFSWIYIHDCVQKKKKVVNIV